jgi:predicted porin
MKGSVSTIALASLLIGSVAHAQTSVTLFGIVDTGFKYVHNSGGQSNQLMMASGSESGSRWGLRGVEDLGGGLSAIFQLENGFSSTSGTLGQGGRLFGRQAFVGFRSPTWGKLTLGRQYDPMIDLVLPVQGNSYLAGVFSTPGDIDLTDGTSRINNSVKWISNNFAGLQFGAIYGVGGVAGATGSGQTYGGAASYKIGAATLAAGYLHLDFGNPTYSTRGTSTADAFYNTSVNKAYESAHSINIVRAGASYFVGPVVIGGYYSFSQYNPDAASMFRASEKYNNFEVFGYWTITPFVSAELGYDYMRSSGDSSARRHQVTLGGDYLLSKRTDIYGVVGYAHASGTDGLGAAQAVNGDTNIDAGAPSQTLVMVGFRHRF